VFDYDYLVKSRTAVALNLGAVGAGPLSFLNWRELKTLRDGYHRAFVDHSILTWFSGLRRRRRRHLSIITVRTAS
jgi:hypothetical protein